MKTYSKLILLVFTSCVANCVCGQTDDCIAQKKYTPENTCMPCTFDARYNVVVRNLLRLNEVERMEQELNKMAEQADAWYKTYGNLKQHGFNALDLDLKKLLGMMERNPDKARDLISWLEGELEKAGCTYRGSYDTRSSGVADGRLPNIQSEFSSVMRQLSFPQYTGPSELTFDCCEEKRWQPGDVFINNITQIDHRFNELQSMFEDLKRLQQVQMSAVQMSVWHFQKYEKSSKEQLERLSNNSLCDVFTNSMVQCGRLRAAEADKLNQLIKQYCETNDKLSFLGAVRALLGNDVADVMSCMIENYTATDLLNSIGETVRKNPKKFSNLKQLGVEMKAFGWVMQFMNLVQLAESAVNVFFDTYMKLGGNHFVLRTQSELWCVAATYYYYAAQSLLYNAAAVYQMKRTLTKVHGFFPKLVIPMPPADSLNTTLLGQKVVHTANTRTSTGTQRENEIEITLPGGKKAVFVRGQFFCGKPRMQTPQRDTRKISFQGGVHFGTGWMSGDVSQPVFEGAGSTQFVQQHQQMLNDAFQGTVFSAATPVRVTSLPALEGGVGFGCLLTPSLEVKAEASGTWQRARATTALRVVRMVMPDIPSQPPSTQQSVESLHAAASSGMFRFQSGVAYHFGSGVRGYAGAGGCAGFVASAARHFKAGDAAFSESKKTMIAFGGGYVEAGLKIPVAARWQLAAGVASQFISLQQRFAAYPQLKLAVMMVR